MDKGVMAFVSDCKELNEDTIVNPYHSKVSGKAW